MEEKKIHLNYGYIPHTTIDCNLHPERQIEELHFLLESEDSDIIEIYCNSIYVMNEIILIEGYRHNNVPHPKGFKITTKHFEWSLIKDEPIEGKYYQSMISDDNMLNNKIKEANERYSDMLKLTIT